MAEGVRRPPRADQAVSATGVAGPDPDDRGNPVGLVFVGIAWQGGGFVRQVHAVGPRGRIRHIAASHAFDLIRRKLTDLELK